MSPSRPRIALAAALLSALAVAPGLRAQSQTVGLFVNSAESSPGYTLFGPIQGPNVYLIDNGGHPVNEWRTANPPGLMGYITPVGTLLRAAAVNPVHVNFRNAIGTGGRLEERDWDNNVVWTMDISNDLELQHHDFKRMSNGNILAIIWTFKTRDEAIQAGRNPAATAAGGFWPDAVYEIQPTPPVGGNVVWEWHAWDHYVQEFDRTKDNFGVVADHPELLDINTPTDDGQQDNNHLNALDYNEDLDQIALSSRSFNEIWIIDHSTTTAEAASHSGGRSGMGGDILYRWGNPQKYGRGTAADKRLHNQHDVQWIPAGRPGAGNLLIYDNGLRREDGSNWSEIDEIVPPLNAGGTYDIAPGAAFGPAEPVWSYPPVADPSFFSPIISGTQRLPNGNTLICEGTSGHLFEVTEDHRIVWDYVSPELASGSQAFQGQNLGVMPPIPLQANAVFKMRRYEADYPGLQGKDLTPTEVIETFDPPPPVPDGRGGTTAMKVAKIAGGGTNVRMSWDSVSCPAVDYNLYWGLLPDAPSLVFQGSRCALGTSGTHDWYDVPGGNLYVLMVGVGEFDIYESSYGTDSFGVERGGYVASNECAITTKSLAASCP